MVHECQNDHERVLFDDENTTSSVTTDSWWFEAIRVADEVENKQNSLQLSNTVGLNLLYIIRFLLLPFIFSSLNVLAQWLSNKTGSNKPSRPLLDLKLIPFLIFPCFITCLFPEVAAGLCFPRH